MASYHVLVNEEDLVLAVYGSALEQEAKDKQTLLAKEFARPIRRLFVSGKMKPYVGQRL